jgi:serine protease AprX
MPSGQVTASINPVTDSLSLIHPLLLDFAQREPTKEIRVIVQATGNLDNVKSAVVRSGGKITTDLQIIHAFVAEMQAQAVLQLDQIDGVRWVSWDAPIQSTACTQCIDTSKLANAYIPTVRADMVWNQSPYRQGQGIGVAVVDSGVNPQDDLSKISGQTRLVQSVAFNNGYNSSVFDNYGHGSHIAGVIGGNGRKLGGQYIGVAPSVNIINVKVGDDLNRGQGTASTVVAGLQWILQNKSTYNIRVVNMSLNSSVAESYHTNPINAAVEILWFNKIVVVVSAGNNGSGAIYPPANDPFVITVGATDDLGTSTLTDDIIPSFSAYGTTIDG